MPKRISKHLRDPNRIAAAIVAVSTAEAPPFDNDTLSKIMAEMSRKGGKRSLETMSATDRKKRAKKAAKAR
jgi:molybdopterin biosynthesis enzyme MoaB